MNNSSDLDGVVAARRLGLPALAPIHTTSKVSPVFVVMGVSGCGKSTVGSLLAAALGLEFLEGDSLHSAANAARMAAGFALTDADRAGWPQTLAERISAVRLPGPGPGLVLVLSRSALKRAYRDILRQGAPDLQFLYLHGDYDLLAARMAARTGHYMPASLLVSQLATLEVPGPDEHAQVFDVASQPEMIVAAAVARWSAVDG